MRHAVASRIATILLTVVGVGLIPGSVTRQIVLEHEVMRLPPAPDQTLTLKVRVRSEQGHQPVAVARVRVLVIQDGVAYLAASGVTDRGGGVTLDHLPRGAAWILADAEGFARGSAQRALGGENGDERPVEMELSAAHVLRVSVADDLGQPVPGAEVEVSGGDPLPVGARADSSGHAVVARLREGPWTLVVHAAGFEEVVRHGIREGETPSVVLRKLGALSVSVLGELGKPAPLARVQIAGSSLWPARMTDTAADGTVRIGGLSAGSYALRATSGSLVSETDVGISLARGEERRVTLKLRLGIFAAARVVEGDAEDAAPVAHARVTLAESGLSPFPLEAVSDDKGNVRLGPIVAAPALLTAQADGYVPRRGVEVPLDGHLVTIVMVRAGTILGRVVDAKGRPVAGASISVVGTSFTGAPIEDEPSTQSFRRSEFDANLLGLRTLIPSGELGVVPGPVPKIPRALDLPAIGPGTSAAASPRDPWVTREDGTFRVTPVSPGRVRVVVRHPEFLEGLSDAVSLAPDGEATADVVLHEGGTLEGRVFDTGGHPVAGASITLAALRGSAERSTRSASDGTFAFAAVPDGVVVTAYPDDEGEARVARTTTKVPEGGRAEVTLTLPDARPAVDVRVKDDRGYPVGAAQIAVGSVDPSVPFRTTVFTDAHGETSIPGARGVALRLTVTAPGHAARSIELPASEASAEVALAAAEGVTGDVREARTGIPLKGAEVTLFASDGPHRAETDGDGRFTLVDVAAGEARLRVRATARVPSEQRLTVADDGRGSQDLGHVELSAEAVVEGTVVDGHGDPVPGARVGKDHVATYVVARGRDPDVAITDGHGRFRLGGLEEGTVALEAYAPDLGRGRLEGVHTIAGRTVDRLTVNLVPAEAEKVAEPGATGGVAVTLGEVAGDVTDVVVVAVADGSEAERAGVAVGDVIVAVDGASVHTIAEARARLAGPLSNDVVVTRKRGDRTESLRVPREGVRR